MLTCLLCKLIEYCVDNDCVEGEMPKWVVKSGSWKNVEKLNEENERRTGIFKK